MMGVEDNVVENGSREGRVGRDFASASLLLFVVCCLLLLLLFVVARLVSRRGTEPSAQCRVHSYRIDKKLQWR